MSVKYSFYHHVIRTHVHVLWPHSKTLVRNSVSARYVTAPLWGRSLRLHAPAPPPRVVLLLQRYGLLRGEQLVGHERRVTGGAPSPHFEALPRALAEFVDSVNHSAGGGYGRVPCERRLCRTVFRSGQHPGRGAKRSVKWTEGITPARRILCPLWVHTLCRYLLWTQNQPSDGA